MYSVMSMCVVLRGTACLSVLDTWYTWTAPTYIPHPRYTVKQMIYNAVLAPNDMSITEIISLFNPYKILQATKAHQY